MGTLLFLGTGASTGIPVVGCSCAVCMSNEPKNKRLRVSALLEVHGKTLLIDSGPDFRTQALRYGIKKVDGLLITHTHYDHIGGLEELRIFNHLHKRSIPCLLSNQSYENVKKLFYYLFEVRNELSSFTSKFEFMPLEEARGEVQFCDVPIRYFSYFQGKMRVLGFRFGDLAYVTDIKCYDEAIFDELNNVSTLVISALRFTSSDLQFSIDEAVDFAKRVGAKKTYLIHISHEVEYTHLISLLPENIKPAYDGLQLKFSL